MRGNFMPHGHCFLWRPDLLSLHVISDALIVISYFLIPFFIYKYMKAKKIQARLLPLLFVGFIFSCGITHLFTIWNFWNSHYWISGVFKAFCAILSVMTVYVIAKSFKTIIGLPSPEDLAEINKSLERKIDERTQELEEKNSDLNQMISILGHDFNNSLSIILGHVELIKTTSSKQDEMVDKSLSSIFGVGMHLAQLINDIQKLGTVQKQDFRLDFINLYNLVDEICKNSNFKEDAVIENEISKDINVKGVESLLVQLFQNLISNAIKYKKAGEPVLVRIVDGIEDGMVSVKVIDNGIGIKEEEIVDIFGMFKRGSNFSPDKDGHGIGLSFCSKIMKLHKGQLTCESTLGEGSTFKMLFLKVL